MNGLTERFCRSLCAISRRKVSAQGARLVRHVWSRLPEEAADNSAGLDQIRPPGSSANDDSARRGSAEGSAFDNAFRFAVEEFRQEPSEEGLGRQRVCLSVPVFAATALAGVRRKNYRDLCYAIGVGLEAHSRLVASLATSARRKGFDPHLLAALVAAIVACGVVEKLPPEKLARAIGLGCSAITAVATGHFPLQAALAARDGVVMVLLVTCAFGAPQDAFACRWGIYETFADVADMNALDLRRDRATGTDALRRILGGSVENNKISRRWSEIGERFGMDSRRVSVKQ